MTFSAIRDFLDSYMNFDGNLNVARTDPYMANGLMVKGKENVEKIGFGVSASIELFKLAQKENCDALIVHHAFNLPSYNRYDSLFQNRLEFLIKSGISLFGYHFLLDAHPGIGHNVGILKVVGAKPVRPFLHHGDPWGWIGECQKESNLEKVLANLKPYLSKRFSVYDFGPNKITKVVAISGKGAPLPTVMQDLIDEKIDLYITGEVHEWNRELFREAGIHFIAGGHYATEVFGLKALEQELIKKFPNLETVWLKLTNEV